MESNRSTFQVRRFIERLQQTSYFEDVADVTLEALLECALGYLAESDHAQHGEIFRGVLHLRPGGEYRGLVYAMASHDAPPTVSEEIVSSATLWRWMSQSSHPLVIDVALAQVAQLNADASTQEPAWSLATESDQLFQAESMQSILSSGATHMCIVPILGLKQQIVGMISIEARCRRAMGRPFIWPDAVGDFTLISAMASALLLSRPHRPEPAMQRGDGLLPVVGDSTLGMVKLLRLFAKQHETMLLMGQTGVGKSRMARWAHAQSARSDGPFEVLDLLSVPDTMQLAHLVGWKRGAFTGAVNDQAGAISRAKGGTLFIDEIDKLSLETQAGLLRLLEERRYRQLGDAVEQDADVRFIVGTNIDLSDAVRQGTFREDLYYRINVLPTRLLPLDERRDEIVAWAKYMLSRCSHGQDVELAAEAYSILEATTWPGNLRQLDNVMRRCFVIALRDVVLDDQVVVVRREHVFEALSIEQGSKIVREERVEGVDGLMRQAARALVFEAISASQRQELLDLDLCDAFKGYVLEEAVTQLGSLEEAFATFDRQRLVDSRNHHRTFRRELKRADALRNALSNIDETTIEWERS